MIAIPIFVAVLLFALTCYFLLRRKETRAPGLRAAMFIIALLIIAFLIWLGLRHGA